MKEPQPILSRTVDFEVRTAADTADGFTLEGYAAVFDSPTRIDSWEGEFDEVIERGAFAKTISERTPVLQFDHGHDPRTGTVPIGAIEDLREDDHGLFVRARLFDNETVRPIRDAIAGGAISGMSFRFQVVRDDWTERANNEDRPPLRTLKELRLFELGPVVFPAYESTTVGVRSLLARLDADERRQLIAELRDEILSDAGPSATSDASPDAGHDEATSGLTCGQREALLRNLTLEGDIR